MTPATASGAGRSGIMPTGVSASEDGSTMRSALLQMYAACLIMSDRLCTCKQCRAGGSLV